MILRSEAKTELESKDYDPDIVMINSSWLSRDKAGYFKMSSTQKIDRLYSFIESICEKCTKKPILFLVREHELTESTSTVITQDNLNYLDKKMEQLCTNHQNITILQGGVAEKVYLTEKLDEEKINTIYGKSRIGDIEQRYQSFFGRPEMEHHKMEALDIIKRIENPYVKRIKRIVFQHNQTPKITFKTAPFRENLDSTDTLFLPPTTRETCSFTFSTTKRAVVETCREHVLGVAKDSLESPADIQIVASATTHLNIDSFCADIILQIDSHHLPQYICTKKNPAYLPRVVYCNLLSDSRTLHEIKPSYPTELDIVKRLDEAIGRLPAPLSSIRDILINTRLLLTPDSKLTPDLDHCIKYVDKLMDAKGIIEIEQDFAIREYKPETERDEKKPTTNLMFKPPSPEPEIFEIRLNTIELNYTELETRLLYFRRLLPDHSKDRNTIEIAKNITTALTLLELYIKRILLEECR
jgi:hypothetical protein